MKGAILPGCVSIHAVFTAIGNAQLHHNWLITDTRCSSSEPSLAALLCRGQVWLTGDLATQAAHRVQVFEQGVFSGFKKSVEMRDALGAEAPTAAVAFLSAGSDIAKLQHPLADIEIAVQGGKTLVVCRRAALVDRLAAAYPGAEFFGHRRRSRRPPT